jgi:threonyl-tRNA synthetase
MCERSGHLAKFGDDMFAPIPDGDDELVLRPSNCPHHAAVFAARGRSYRELPLRVAELGQMYRSERSGVLSGLSRVRAISLNDAYIFCVPEQVGEEVRLVLALMRHVHAVEFARRCVAAGLRAEVVIEGSLGARVRDARLVPYVAVVGAQEVADGRVSLRSRDGGSPGSWPVAGAVDYLVGACAPPRLPGS